MKGGSRMVGNNKSSGPSGTRRLVAPELLPLLDFLPSFEFNEQVLQAIRAGIGEDPKRPPLSPEQQAVACEQRFIPGPPGAPDVRLLVYTPPGPLKKIGASTMRPAYLHMHGGGYILGNPEINDASNRSFAAELDCVVVSVDYRLAPETRFPGALEDCYASLMWLHSNAGQLGVDLSRIAIGGESAGGGHAAALAILARNRGAGQICLQLLDSPMLDDRTGSASDPHPYCGEFVWTANSNRFGWRSLLGVEPGGPAVPAEAVPARVADLTGLPPAFITVGALDLFVEEDLEYARRLIRSGVPAELHVIPGAFHGFGVAGGQAPQVQACIRLRRDALARALASHKT
jgi:acetyl esterase/lipase